MRFAEQGGLLGVIRFISVVCKMNFNVEVRITAGRLRVVC